MKMRSKTGLMLWLLTLTTATCGVAAEVAPAPLPAPSPKATTPAKPVTKTVESAPTPAVWEPVRLALF